MCGIGGIIQLNRNDTFDDKQTKLMIALQKKLEIRGTDAWGMFLTHKGEQPNLDCWEDNPDTKGELFKMSGSFSDWMEERDGEIFLDTANLVLSHTRNKTQGDHQENQNNHPFQTEHFILSHNGTISNSEMLKKQFNLDYEVETDSYVIVALIEHFYKENDGDVVSAIQTASSYLKGGFACWMYDKTKENVYLFRKSNPIDYYIDREKGIFIFASTSTIINNAYGKVYGQDIFNSTVTSKEETIYCLNGDKLYNVGELTPELETETTTQKQLPKFETQEVPKEAQKISQILDASNYPYRLSYIEGDTVIIFKDEALKDAVLDTKMRDHLYNIKEFYRVTIPDKELKEFSRQFRHYLMNNLLPDLEDEKDEFWLYLALGELSNLFGVGYALFDDQIKIMIPKNIDAQKDKKWIRGYFEQYGLTFGNKDKMGIKRDSDGQKQLEKLMEDLDIGIEKTDENGVKYYVG